MSEPCRLRQGIFGRWFIFHPEHDEAWTGARWEICSADGVPTGQFQVCNFASQQEAREYCWEHGLEPE